MLVRNELNSRCAALRAGSGIDWRRIMRSLRHTTIEQSELRPPVRHGQFGQVAIVDAPPTMVGLSKQLGAFGLLVQHPPTDTDDIVAWLRRCSPDICLMELRQTGFNGTQLLEAVRETLPKLPVIVTTAYPSFAAAQWAVELGVADYITKPLCPSDVLRALGVEDTRSVSGQWVSIETIRQRYVDMVLHHYGSITRSARVLGLERRSLRRTLSSWRVRASTGV